MRVAWRCPLFVGLPPIIQRNLITMTKIETYDATLRDGMQGEGMSLTAPRSCAWCSASTRSAST